MAFIPAGMNAYPFATLAADEAGSVGCAFWQLALIRTLPPLTLLDLDVASFADLDAWLAGLAERLTQFAHSMGYLAAPPPRRSPHAQFLAGFTTRQLEPPCFMTPAPLTTALVMRGLPVEPLPEALQLMSPADIAVRAGDCVSRGGPGALRFAPAAADKMKRHPFNVINVHTVGAPLSAITLAFYFGVLRMMAAPMHLKSGP